MILRGHRLSILALAIIALLLWLPGGFRMTGIREEWLLGHFAADGLSTLWQGTIGQPDNQYHLRPLHAIPWAVSALIPPNVIVGQNILQCLLFFGKAAALYGLIIELFPRQRAVAFAMAVLFIIYPSETGLYGLRDLAIHSAVFLFVVSLYLLAVYERVRHWILLIVSLAVNAVGLLTYEVAFPLAFLAPFVLLLRRGNDARRVLAVIGVSLVAPILLLIRYGLILSAQVNSYQVNLVEAGLPDGVAGSMRPMADSLMSAYRWNASSSWREAINTVQQPGSLMLVTAMIAVGAASVLWVSHRSDDQPEPVHLLVWVIVGQLVLGLGFAPYLPTPIRTETERVFILSSAGAALSVVALCQLIAGFAPGVLMRRVTFTVLSAALISLASSKALAQHAEFIRYSHDERHLLAQFVEIAPGLAPDTCVVLIDPPQNERFFFYGRHWGEALQYLYGNYTLKGIFCDTDGRLACQFDARSRAISTADFSINGCPPDRVMVLDYAASYSSGHQLQLLDALPVTLSRTGGDGYRPDRLIQPGSPPPAVIDAVFEQWPYQSEMPSPLETLRIDFDRPVYGLGWRHAEVNAEGVTWVWTIAPEATMPIGLLANQDYEITAHVLWEAGPGILKTVRLAWNGEPIDAVITPQANGTLLITAHISRNRLAPDGNILSLIVDHVVPAGGDDPDMLGVAVDWVDLRPRD